MPECVMAVFAHPDDEIAIGGILAGCASEGVRTVLVCATSGELGGSGDPPLPSPTELGRLRRSELQQSAKALRVSNLHILPYGDSGVRREVIESPLGSLCHAVASDVIGQIAQLIRVYRPQLIVTFGPDGVYGHLDHIAIGAYTTAAFALAARPGCDSMGADRDGWQAHRLFYATLSSDARRLILQTLAARQIGQITHRIDVGQYVPIKMAAAACHRTQGFLISRLEELQAFSEGVDALSTEFLVLATECGARILTPRTQQGSIWSSLMA